MANLLQELKRRKVFRVAAVYAVVAWLLIQVADTLFPALQLPDWTVTFVSVLLLFGFLPGVVIAWAYERTSEGVRPDRLVQASPGSVATSAQPVNYLILIVVLIVAGVQIADRFSLAGIRGGGSEGSQSHNASVLRAVLKLEQPLTAVFPDPVSFLELSSDGSTLYFTRNTPDSNQLVMKQLDTGEERAIVDAPGSLFHRISPDGSRILYAVQGGFAISTLDGRSTGQISVRRTSPFGDWLTDDEILFTSVDDTRIHSISISTNTERRLTELDDDYGSDAHPFRLPGGNAFLYVRQSFSRGDEAQVLVYDLRSGTSIPLIEGANSPRYLASGHIAFTRARSIWVVPFDAESLQLTGTAYQVIDGIDSNPVIGYAGYTVSDTGRLVYVASEMESQSRGLTLSDLAGNSQALELPEGDYQQFELSPDKKTLALVLAQADGRTDIWVYDIDRKSVGKRTFSGSARRPKWTLDGRNLVYQEEQGIWMVSADGTSQPEQIINAPLTRPESFVESDGTLLYLEGIVGGTRINQASFRDGSWSSSPLIDTPFPEWGSRVSPDGRWVAYVGNETGRQEVYVRNYPDVGNGRWQVSTSGGREPIWSDDGSRLYFIEPNRPNSPIDYGRLMVVDVKDSTEFSVTTANLLLDSLPLVGTYPPNFAVLDGTRFIHHDRGEVDLSTQQVYSELQVVENWLEEIRQFEYLNE